MAPRLALRKVGHEFGLVDVNESIEHDAYVDNARDCVMESVHVRPMLDRRMFILSSPTM